MLTDKQLNEVRQHLENAQNPVFFFDNDPDGLCSFILLRRFCEKGKGVPVKGAHETEKGYFRRVKEFESDYIFILDNGVSKEFVQEAQKYNIPIVVIDHHPAEFEKIPKEVNYYNPLLNDEKKEKGEPVTALCYQLTRRKDDLWIAIVGCVYDFYVPDFYKEFQEKYPDLSISEYKNAFDILYSSAIGQITRTLGNGLKDRTTNVINMMKFLLNVKNPYEILEDSKGTHSFLKRSREIESKRKQLIYKATKDIADNDKIIFFKYSGDLSISRDITNELYFRYPDKIIVVARESEDKVTISASGKKIRTIALEAIKDLKDASGGGHEEAIGIKLRKEDLQKFKNNLLRLLNNPLE